MTHLAIGDYDSMADNKDDAFDCGTVAEHLKNNTCPKKQGVVGDCHYELYVQQDVIVTAMEEKDAESEADARCTLEDEINDYLKSINVTGFDSRDFDGECINSEATGKSEGVSPMRIVHEKLYYDNEIIA